MSVATTSTITPAERERLRQQAFEQGERAAKAAAEKTKADTESGKSRWEAISEIYKTVFGLDEKKKKQIPKVQLTEGETKNVISLQVGTADTAADYVDARRKYAFERAQAGDLEEADRVENEIKIALVVLAHGNDQDRQRYGDIMVIEFSRAAEQMFTETGHYPEGYEKEAK